MNNSIIAQGEVNIQVFKDGRLVDTMQEKNLFVDLGKTNVARLLGGDVTGLPISKIGVGTNNTPPVVGDAALTGMFSKAVSNVTYPAANKVMFHYDIDNTEANGMTIREFGLLTSANVLCARKHRGADIVKTNAIRLVGTWTITIN